MCRCMSHIRYYLIMGWANLMDRVKGRPHYYSSKKEEFAGVRFDLDAGLFFLCTCL